MFKKIVVLEPIAFVDEMLKHEIKELCNELVVFDTEAAGDEEKINRIADADCVMVSYKTEMGKNVIDHAKNLKFVCMCCSYYGAEFSKVDTNYITEKGIKFSALEGHGDNGVVEFTVAKTISLLQGFDEAKLKRAPSDLTGMKLGILGLGSIGLKIAKAFNAMNTEVYYYSRTRKPEHENNLLKYLPLEELLKTVDVLSINLNRDVCLIGGENLKIFGTGKAIINTSIGKCYEIDSLKEWLKNKNNYYIFDKSSLNDELQEILNFKNALYTDHIVGDTKECVARARMQILSNLKNFKEQI